MSRVSYYWEWQRGGQEREETGKMAEHKAVDQCSEQADNNITYKVVQQMDGLWWQRSPPGATTCLVFSTRKGNFIKVGFYIHTHGEHGLEKTEEWNREQKSQNLQRERAKDRLKYTNEVFMCCQNNWLHLFLTGKNSYWRPLKSESLRKSW